MRCYFFRHLLAVIYIPVIQEELDIFRELHNNSRGRKQVDKLLPTGIPLQIFNHPEAFGAENCGTPLSDERIEDMIVESGVDLEEDFVPAVIRTKIAEIGFDLSTVNACNAKEKFCELQRLFYAHCSGEPVQV